MVALNLVNRPNKRRQTPDQVSELTTNRLSVYLRCLNELDAAGVQAISSQALAEQFHLNAAQIRKDLAYFGEFGVRGVGYYVTDLRRHLRSDLRPNLHQHLFPANLRRHLRGFVQLYLLH